MNQSLDQQRAAWAWQKVMDYQASATKEGFKAYTNLSKGSAAMIMQSSLMPTLAFYGSKAFSKKEANSADGGKEHEALLKQICSWIAKKDIKSQQDYVNFMDSLVKLSSSDYRHFTEEALAVIRWIRHFASAVKSQQDLETSP